MWRNRMKSNLTTKDFKKWKEDWYNKVTKCSSFICCHELDSCGIERLCGNCSIYETWLRNKDIYEECEDVSCIDCMLRYQCKRVRKLFNDSIKHNDNLMKRLAEM